MIQTDKLWKQIVHYYIDKKGYTKEDANKIAERVILREMDRKICHNNSCGHSVEEHINKKDQCLVSNCDCKEFQIITK